MKNVIPTLQQSASLRWRMGILRDGKQIWKTPWRTNLILDSGLDKAGTVKWANCFTACLFGNQVAPTPVRRDSASTTFTVTGIACVASGNFFVVGDVGRLIKFNGAGGEYYIATYIDAQNVTLSATPSPAITAETATIWYVNQTALESLHSATSSYSATGGANSTTYSTNTVKMKRTYVGAAVGAAVTLTEIGFSNSGTNTNIFDRDIIPGGVSLTTGDQAIAVAELWVTLEPGASTAAANVGTGYDTAGNYLVVKTAPFTSVLSNGNTDSGDRFFDNNSTFALRVATATFSLPAFGATQAPPSYVDPTTATLAAYTNGTFRRDETFVWSVSVANTTLHGYLNDDFNVIQWAHRLTATFAKTSSQVLTTVIRKSWRRLLTN